MRRAIFLFCAVVCCAAPAAARAGTVLLCGLDDRFCQLSGTNVRDQRIRFTDLCDQRDVAEAKKRPGAPASFAFSTPDYCKNVGRTGFHPALSDESSETTPIILGVTFRMAGSLLDVDDCSWRTADDFAFYYIAKLPHSEAASLYPVNAIEARGPAMPAAKARAMLARIYAAEAKAPTKPADSCTRPAPQTAGADPAEGMVDTAGSE